MSIGRPTSSGDPAGFGFCVLNNGWEVGRFGCLSGLEGYVHAVTTRKGPDVKDLATGCGQAASQLLDQFGLEAVAWLDQVHGADILPVERAGRAGQGDGLVTNVPGLGLMMRCADCAIILAVDPAGAAVGVAHASWRGTSERIACRLIEKMSELFGSDPGGMIACISPSAGPCCYEVKDSFRRAMLGRLGAEADRSFQERCGRLYFDLWDANGRQLLQAGLREDNIHLAGLCTICNNDRFPSYRAEGDRAGRFAVMIAASR